MCENRKENYLINHDEYLELLASKIVLSALRKSFLVLNKQIDSKEDGILLDRKTEKLKVRFLNRVAKPVF